MTRLSTTPASPALPVEPVAFGETAQRVPLRRSVAMRAVLGFFVLTATLAVLTCLTPHLGVWRAAPLALATAVLLMLCAIRHERAQPVALRIGRDGLLSVWGRAGALLAQGRVAGCAQWSGRLLVLTLAPENDRVGGKHTLLLPADALCAPVFRELSVLGRRASGA